MKKKQLAEAEKFEALFQYASLGILVAADDGEIVLANNFLLQLFAYNDINELLGKKVECLIPARYTHKHTSYRESYSHKPEKRPMGTGRDLFGLRKDGSEFPVEISLSNYKSAERTFIIAFVSDISLRKKVEQEVMEQRQQLEEKNSEIEKLNDELEQKVEQRTLELKNTLKELEDRKEELTKALSKEKELSDLKSRFVSMASHEFRTPLSTILSSASLVAKYTETEQQENRDKHISRIKSSVKNMIDMLNEFLSLGKMDEGRFSASFSEFSLPDFIKSTVAEVETLLKPGQHIITKHSGNSAVLLDANMLKNSMLNLISNAVKFSDDGKNIYITSSITRESASISVKDEGMGISKEDQQHLFERFFRGTNVSNIQGTGLGLHIVSKYAELMGGTIACKSELGQGTEFILKFANKTST